jgi:excisionase family DNA binding protein
MGRKMTTTEVADLIRMSPDHVRRLALSGALPARRIGPRGRLLFDEQEVAAALRRVGQAEAAAAAPAR